MLVFSAPRLAACALALVGIAASTSGCGGETSPQTPPDYAVGDSLLAHDTLSVVSAALGGEVRRVNVYLPAAYARDTARAFAVVVMPDGGEREDFPHLTGTVDTLIAEGAIPPLLVVGIENTERRRDLTGPTSVASDREIAPRVGGSAAFRRFIADELMPEIRRRYRTTDTTAIVGESLAGLFVVETFFEAPDLFDAYIAISPSLWWNRRALVAAAPAWLAAHPGVRARLYVTSADEADIAQPADSLADAFTAAAPAGLSWTYAPRPDLTHGTVYRATKRDALTWALGAWGRAATDTLRAAAR